MPFKEFNDFLERYRRERRPQENSPLDSLFITYGARVSDLSEVYISYIQAKQLLERRFFCEQEQHTIGYAELPDPDSLKSILNDAFLNRYATSLFEYLQAFNRNMLAETLTQLTNELYHAGRFD